jgi:hypothetical protein
MPLIKCPDCSKAVSDRAVACNECGCPLGSIGFSGGNVAFEKRVEEYKTKGYMLLDRTGDTVKLVTKRSKIYNPQIKTTAVFMNIGAICGCITIITGFLLLMFASFIIGLVILLLGAVCSISITRFLINLGTVVISLTKTGNIEETGNTYNFNQ